LSFSALEERVLHETLREDLRRVVARARLAIATREAEDERALRVATVRGLPVRALVRELGLAVLREVTLGDEEALLGGVGVLVARTMHLVEHLLREEAAVAEEALVHRAELADAELGVADAPATRGAAPSASSFGREREQADHLLEPSLRSFTRDRRGVPFNEKSVLWRPPRRNPRTSVPASSCASIVNCLGLQPSFTSLKS
jgi:hypothetical protein